MLIRLQVVAICVLILTMEIAMAQGKVQEGKQVFNQCRACHSLEAGKNGVGPSLHGVVGRKAGTAPGYNYSHAMKNSEVVWNEDTLDKYLVDPPKFIPGNKMVFPGIKDNTQRQNLIAYLKEAVQ